MADGNWAALVRIEPRELDREELLLLASFAVGLCSARRQPGVNDSELQEIGHRMVRLLGHIAHLERR